MDITLPPDFKEFLRLLNTHGVEYLLIGGYAVGYHGYPLSLAQIYAALAYYYEHQAEFEAEILRQAERAKAWAEAAKDSPIRQRLKEQGLLP